MLHKTLSRDSRLYMLAFFLDNVCKIDEKYRPKLLSSTELWMRVFWSVAGSAIALALIALGLLFFGQMLYQFAWYRWLMSIALCAVFLHRAWVTLRIAKRLHIARRRMFPRYRVV